MNKYFDLRKELDYVIEKYGAHEGYNIPAIEWSDITYWGICAQYQYWKNKIIISRVLDSPITDPEFLRYIIFHEYTHQLYAEHDERFKKEMKRFSNHDKREARVNTYFDQFPEPPKVKPSLPPLDTEKTILFCRLPLSEDSPDSYYSENLCYINHNVTGMLYGRIPEKNCRERAEQVLWVIESGEDLFVVGVAKNIQLFPDVQIVHDGKLFDKDGNKGADARIQFQCKQRDLVYLAPVCSVCRINKSEIPKSFYKDNVFSNEDLHEKTYQEIIDCYKTFDYETNTVGMWDQEIEAQASVFTTNDADKLYELACEETSLFRKVWILNKCLTMKQNYRFYKELASIFDDLSIFDKAIENYEKALKYRNEESVKERIETIKSVIPEYEKYGLW